MGVFEYWPYVNFHELNLSWILKELKDLEDIVGSQIVDVVARAGVAANTQAISDLTTVVNNNAITAHNEAQAAANTASTASTTATNAANTANAASTTATNTANALLVSRKVIISIGDMGNLSANDHGYLPVSFTVPDGYKTTGLYSVVLGHPGNANVIGVSASFQRGATGAGTAYLNYYAHSAVSQVNSDFTLYIDCVPSTFNID